MAGASPVPCSYPGLHRYPEECGGGATSSLSLHVCTRTSPMVAGTQCLPDSPLGAGCQKEVRVSNGGLWVYGAYLAVSACSHWPPTGSKPSDSSDQQEELNLARSPCLDWLPAGK